MDIKIASFNVENLFDRAALLDMNDHSIGDQYLAIVGELEQQLRLATYDKARILKLWKDLKGYVKVNENRGHLFSRGKVVANGRSDWEGSIELSRKRIPDMAQKNTGKVLREVDADVVCLVEVESRPVLQAFATDQLPKRYPYQILFDGNDDRGIDVAMLSKYPVGAIRTHVFDKNGTQTIFSRDCLEVEVQLSNNATLWMLLNHFKSKGYGVQATSDAKRRAQAERVKAILGKYDLSRDLVIVAGDFNDHPASQPLQPLLRMQRLHDVLKEKIPNEADRWTYHYKKNEQIDYLLVSDPLRDALRDAGTERRGMFDLEKYSGGTEKAWKSVDAYRSSASDHAAVWAEFRL
jgi:endonuclease/exonuclease/phosphatase family metal-dependent hydrolase